MSVYLCFLTNFCDFFFMRLTAFCLFFTLIPKPMYNCSGEFLHIPTLCTSRTTGRRRPSRTQGGSAGSRALMIHQQISRRLTSDTATTYQSVNLPAIYARHANTTAPHKTVNPLLYSFWGNMQRNPIQTDNRQTASSCGLPE